MHFYAIQMECKIYWLFSTKEKSAKLCILNGVLQPTSIETWTWSNTIAFHLSKMIGTVTLVEWNTE